VIEGAGRCGMFREWITARSRTRPGLAPDEVRASALARGFVRGIGAWRASHGKQVALERAARLPVEDCLWSDCRSCIYRPKNAIVRAAGSSLEKLIFDEDMVPALVVARFDRLARGRQPLPSGLLGTDRNRRVGRAEQRRSSARRHTPNIARRQAAPI